MPTTLQTASPGDTLTDTTINAIKNDLDDLFGNGSDRLRVRAAVSGTALKIDIGAGAFFIGSVKGTYAGGTDITVTASQTNYVMIDSSGTIQISTSGRNNDYARLAAVVCDGSGITSITHHKMDVFGGPIGAKIVWSEITGTTKSMTNGEGYIANNASLVTFTLPTTAAVGERVAVMGKGAGGRKIAQNASQLIRFGGVATTTGTGGYIQSTTQYDLVILECTAANTERVVLTFAGLVETDASELLVEEYFSEYRASDAEAAARTNTLKFVTPDHLGIVGSVAIITGSRTRTAGTGTVNQAHSLPTTPQRAQMIARTTSGGNPGYEEVSEGFSDGSINKCVYRGTEDAGSSTDSRAGTANNAAYIYHGDSGGNETMVCDLSFDATNVDMDRTYTDITGPSTVFTTVYYVLFVHC